MKKNTFFSIFTSVVFFSLSLIKVNAQDGTNATETIINNASDDNIDLSVLDISDVVLEEIAALYESVNTTERRRNVSPFARRQSLAPNNLIDVHGHVVPSWYKALVPVTGGNPTPDWTLDGHLDFMNQEGIKRAVVSISTPGANVFQGDKALTVALARLLNEQVAAYCLANPTRLDFYAVVPLPYTTEAITEATYAIKTLGAVGIMLTSNFEGTYLGNPQLKPFFQAVNSFGGHQILYVHPSTAYIKSGNKLIEANPTVYPSGNVEFYFETARTIMDLTLSQTIHNFTNINFVIPHVGGAFPAAIDRILKSTPAIYNSSLAIYSTRFWWDSAGPTYFHQISGLLGYSIPTSQLLFGTDFPYAPNFTQPGSLAAVQNSPLFTTTQKTEIFTTNAQALFGSKVLF